MESGESYKVQGESWLNESYEEIFREVRKAKIQSYSQAQAIIALAQITALEQELAFIGQECLSVSAECQSVQLTEGLNVDLINGSVHVKCQAELYNLNLLDDAHKQSIVLEETNIANQSQLPQPHDCEESLKDLLNSKDDMIEELISLAERQKVELQNIKKQLSTRKSINLQAKKLVEGFQKNIDLHPEPANTLSPSFERQSQRQVNLQTSVLSSAANYYSPERVKRSAENLSSHQRVPQSTEKLTVIRELQLKLQRLQGQNAYLREFIINPENSKSLSQPNKCFFINKFEQDLSLQIGQQVIQNRSPPKYNAPITFRKFNTPSLEPDQKEIMRQEIDGLWQRILVLQQRDQKNYRLFVYSKQTISHLANLFLQIKGYFASIMAVHLKSTNETLIRALEKDIQDLCVSFNCDWTSVNKRPNNQSISTSSINNWSNHMASKTSVNNDVTISVLVAQIQSLHNLILNYEAQLKEVSFIGCQKCKVPSKSLQKKSNYSTSISQHGSVSDVYDLEAESLIPSQRMNHVNSSSGQAKPSPTIPSSKMTLKSQRVTRRVEESASSASLYKQGRKLSYSSFMTVWVLVVPLNKFLSNPISFLIKCHISWQTGLLFENFYESKHNLPVLPDDVGIRQQDSSKPKDLQMVEINKGENGGAHRAAFSFVAANEADYVWNLGVLVDYIFNNEHYNSRSHPGLSPHLSSQKDIQKLFDSLLNKQSGATIKWAVLQLEKLKDWAEKSDCQTKE